MLLIRKTRKLHARDEVELTRMMEEEGDGEGNYGDGLGSLGETLGETWKPWILVLSDGEKRGNGKVEKKIRDEGKWGKEG